MKSNYFGESKCEDGERNRNFTDSLGLSRGEDDELVIRSEKARRRKKNQKYEMLSLRVELKTSRLLNGCSNQLSYES